MPAPTLVIGAPCWIDLFSSDTSGATEFYGRIFGWKAEEPRPEFGGYFTFTKDGKHVAGCMANSGDEGYPDGWSIHLMTDDADRVAEAAAGQGATVVHGPMVVAENGTSLNLLDPGGAMVGAWEPNQMKGFELMREPGTPAWFELHTRDYDKAVAFYRDVFKWDAHVMSDTEEFRYTTLGEGEGALAGIMDETTVSGDDDPPHWAVYFAVGDADATLEQVVELGGTVIQPAHDTPYGRLAVAADPTGAAFRLLQDNQ